MERQRVNVLDFIIIELVTVKPAIAKTLLKCTGIGEVGIYYKTCPQDGGKHQQQLAP